MEIDAVDKNTNLRCRTILKPYVNHYVKCYGRMMEVHRNQDLTEHINKDRNALIVEVHLFDDLTKNQPLQIDIDHVHCQIKSQKLNSFVEQDVMFEAKVRSYVATYHQQKETRYGLTDLRITSKNKTQINQINQLYRDQLTNYQTKLLTCILKNLSRKQRKTIPTTNQIKKTLLYLFNNISDRTNFLTGCYQVSLNKKRLSVNQREKLNTYYHANHPIQSWLNTIYPPTKQQQIYQENQRLKSDMKHYQTQIRDLKDKNQQQFNQLIHDYKNVSFWQLVKNYWLVKFNLKRQHIIQKQKEKPTIKFDDLQKLKQHFNQK